MKTFTERLAIQAEKPSRIYGPRARATARPLKRMHLITDKAPGVWDIISRSSKAFG